MLPADPYDIVIAGAGAAGISLALEFSGTRHRVCLIESGALEYEQETQDLYRGKSIGHQYEDLDISRLRYFGGTTNHWGGYCSPLLAYSFEPQPWIPHSGWPIRQDDLNPYYDRAIDILGLERAGWTDGPGWQADVVGDAFGDPEFPLSPLAFEDRAFVVHPTRMGPKFRESLAAADNIDVVLNANVTEVLTNETARTVEGVRIESLAGRSEIVRARFYILALGGIENPRILLSSSGVQSEGLGNGNDLVGRFFSDHAFIDAAQLMFPERKNVTRHEQRPFGSAEAIIYKDLSYAAQKDNKLVSGMVKIDAVGGGSVPGIGSVKELVRSGSRAEIPDEFGRHLKEILVNIVPLAKFGIESAWHGRPLADFANLTFNLDPAPNPDSRVRLGSERDSLGMRRVELDWQLTDMDRRTFRWMIENLASSLGEQNAARVHLDFDLSEIDDMIFWHWHNCCTTRMADDPKNGVVDAQCRVHGIDNLYAAGSSVFPTVGAGPPTFSIVALAIRLADHLKTRLS